MNLSDAIARYKELSDQRTALQREVEQHIAELYSQQKIVRDLQTSLYELESAFVAAADDLHEAITGTPRDRTLSTSDPITFAADRAHERQS